MSPGPVVFGPGARNADSAQLTIVMDASCSMCRMRGSAQAQPDFPLISQLEAFRKARRDQIGVSR
jgi:hypothetical protein